MGYYTTYELEWTPPIPSTSPCPHCGGTAHLLIPDAIADRIKAPTLEGGKWSIQQNLEESTKWYDHEADMKALSAEFPKVLFTLRGEGEESGDVWVKYFKNGKMQSSKA